MTKFCVMTKKMKNGKSFSVPELTRTDRQAAERDVQIFKDICGRHAWVEELEDAS